MSASASSSESNSTVTTQNYADSFNSTVNNVKNISNAGNFYLQYGDSAIASLGEASGAGGGEGESWMNPKNILIFGGAALALLILFRK